MVPSTFQKSFLRHCLFYTWFIILIKFEILILQIDVSDIIFFNWPCILMCSVDNHRIINCGFFPTYDRHCTLVIQSRKKTFLTFRKRYIIFFLWKDHKTRNFIGIHFVFKAVDRICRNHIHTYYTYKIRQFCCSGLVYVYLHNSSVVCVGKKTNLIWKINNRNLTFPDKFIIGYKRYKNWSNHAVGKKSTKVW